MYGTRTFIEQGAKALAIKEWKMIYDNIWKDLEAETTSSRCKDCAYLVADECGNARCDDCGKLISDIKDKDCSMNQSF